MWLLKFLVFASSMVFLSLGLGAAEETRSKIKRSLYSVPVDPELAPFATFKINEVQVAESEEGLRITYKLPPELMGSEAEEVILSQQDGNDELTLIKMAGRQIQNGRYIDIADASCGRHPFRTNLIQCMIFYHSMFIDQQMASDFVMEKYNGTNGLEERLRLVKFFANEPSGVLSVELE